MYDELAFNCPFCGDNRSRFYLNDNTGLGYCHNCEWRGPIDTLVALLLGLNDEAVYNLIHGQKAKAKFSTRLNMRSAEARPIITLPEGFQRLELPETESNRLFWKYMTKERGIPAQTVLDYGIGYTRTGYHKWRVVIPVTWEGQLVSWVARSIRKNIKKSEKALTPLGNKQSEYLLNLDRLKDREEVVLVEGPFDMLKVPDLAVASFGKRLSLEQAALLRKSGVKHVIVCYDDDAAAERDATAERISEMFRCSIATLPPGRDPGDLDPGTTRDLVRAAVPYTFRRY